MTQKEIIEENKLMAVFMGGTRHRYSLSNKEYYSIGKRDVMPENMKYHSDWNELMPVVEKIENMYHQNFPINVNIGGDGAVISINPSNAGGEKFTGKKSIANTLNSNYFNDYPGADQITKIQGVYEAVVTFINWYNLQHPHQ